MFDIALIIAVVVALTEFVKRIGILPAKYLPATSLFFGLLAGFLYVDGFVNEKIMYGLMMGLSAGGLFDQSKIITKDDING